MPLFDDPDAVVAIGLLQHDEGGQLDLGEASGGAVRRVRRRVATGTVQVRFDIGELQAQEVPTEVVSALSDAWKQGLEAFRSTGRRRELRMFIEEPTRGTTREIRDLVERASGVDSVTIIDRAEHGTQRWGWPLRIGTVGPIGRSAVRSYYHQALFELVDVEQSGADCDLLIIDDPMELDEFRLLVPVASIALVFVSSQDQVQDAAELLGDRVHYQAAGVVHHPDGLGIFVHRFLDELAHDQPPDIAIRHAVLQPEDYSLRGDPQLLDRARVTLMSAHLEAALETGYETGDIEADVFAQAMDAMDDLPAAGDVGYWEHEGDGATATVEATERGRAAVAAIAAPAPIVPEYERRFLQAQVFGGVNETRRTRSFEPNADHEIRVRIGPTELDWMAADRPFPDRDLPPHEARLTVGLVAPGVLDSPEQRDVLLRTVGPSSVASFVIHVPAALETVEASISVYHKGKHLQSAQLSGPVTITEDSPIATGIAFERGAASTTDLSHQQEFDLAVSRDRSEWTLSFFNPDAETDQPSHELRPTLVGLDQAVGWIRDALFEGATRMDQLESGIDGAGLPTIRDLAEWGEDMRNRLFDDASDIRRVQVSSPSSADYFPIEFLYDYVRPTDVAELCTEFKRTEGPGCSATCRAAAGDPSVVCPSGFWALNRIIERQVRTKDRADTASPESSDRQPRLLPMSSVVFAASDEVNAVNADEVESTITAMEAMAPVHAAATWDEWADLVNSHYPSLLVALPHNVETQPFQRLRIEMAEDLALNRIERRHLAPTGAPVGPAVLLLGCNSASADVQYQDFINEMRCHGAAIVVGTLSYVVGQHAAGVAREFVRQLWASQGDQSIGEIIRQVRGRMLVADNLMALALVAFGDADWRFAAQEV